MDGKEFEAKHLAEALQCTSCRNGTYFNPRAGLSGKVQCFDLLVLKRPCRALNQATLRDPMP